MTIRRTLVAFVLAWLSFMSLAGAAAQAPQRIISLVPALTEMLFTIGAGSGGASVPASEVGEGRRMAVGVGPAVVGVGKPLAGFE